MTVLHDPLGDAVVELLTLASRPAWHRQAACRWRPQEWWYPDRQHADDGRQAREICDGCPVRAECAEFAIEHGEEFGVWGGLSERERRAIRRERKTEATGRPRRERPSQREVHWRFGDTADQARHASSRRESWACFLASA